MGSNRQILYFADLWLSPKLDDAISTEILDNRVLRLAQKKITEISDWSAETISRRVR
jgi:hypothetical protein